jgi:hypothetical protein
MQHTMTGPAPKTKTAPPPADLVGRVRRFGPRGVLYEVIALVSPEEVRIRVITTGEVTTYAIADVLTDPED